MTLKTKRKPKNKKKPPRLLISTGYRYNIKARLAELTPVQKSKVLCSVYTKCQTDKHTVNRYLNELKGGTQRNSLLILGQFAKELKCTIDELINK